MAKQDNGFMGGFSGKLGPAVGYQWKGVWCVRARPRKVYNPRTEAQQEHRTIFREEVRLAGRMSWAVNIGLKAAGDELHITAQNFFVKLNQQAFSLEEGRLKVDYEHLCVSMGPVAPVEITSAVVDGDNVLRVSFDKNPYGMKAKALDNVYLWVWCPELQTGYLSNPVYRHAKQMAVALADALASRELHVYAFVQDEQGRCSVSTHWKVGEEAEEETLLPGDESVGNMNMASQGDANTLAEGPKAAADGARGAAGRRPPE